MRLTAVRVLIFSMLFCFLSHASWAGYSGPYTLIAPIAIDGDTLRADVPVWPGMLADDVSIRVIGVDTPEISAPKCPAEKSAGLAAKEFTEAWIMANYPIFIGSIKPDKYSGRFDAIVIGSNGTRLSDALIQAGHGRAYNGGVRQTWCN